MPVSYQRSGLTGRRILLPSRMGTLGLPRTIEAPPEPQTVPTETTVQPPEAVDIQRPGENKRDNPFLEPVEDVLMGAGLPEEISGPSGSYPTYGPAPAFNTKITPQQGFKAIGYGLAGLSLIGGNPVPAGIMLGKEIFSKAAPKVVQDIKSAFGLNPPDINEEAAWGKTSTVDVSDIVGSKQGFMDYETGYGMGSRGETMGMGASDMDTGMSTEPDMDTGMSSDPDMDTGQSTDEDSGMW